MPCPVQVHRNGNKPADLAFFTGDAFLTYCKYDWGKKVDLTLTKSSGAQPWISITDYDKKVMMMLYLVCLLLHVIRTQLESPSVFENCDSQNTCGS